MSTEPVYARARGGLRACVAGRLAERFRRRRLELYRRVLEPRPGERVVDVGCGPAGLAGLDPGARVTGVDREPRPAFPGERFVRADARALPFAADEFEIAYSNSLVEHLAPADRARFASELRRVGGRYFVQTPNRHFPIEPHALLPLVQYLPPALRRRVWRLGVARGEFEDIALLDARELSSLFPDALILRERVGPLTKSLVAAGPRELLAPTRRRAS